MGQRKHDTGNLRRQSNSSQQQRTGGLADPFTQEADHRDKVVEVIKPLHNALHDSSLANDRQERSAALAVTRVRVAIFERSVVRLFCMGDSPMKQFPTLPCGFILERNHWRFSVRAFL